MRKIFLITILLFSGFVSAAPITDEVVGIWATANSEFRGDAVVRGEAIYLDSDGVGGYIGANEKDVLGVRIVVTSFDPATRILTFKMLYNGNDGPTQTVVHDPINHLLIWETNGSKFERRKAGPLPVPMRRLIGLEQRKTP